MTEDALAVESINLSFSGVDILNNVSLRLEQGRINGIIGPNGAGKTSLFNCLTGLYTPQSGSIRLAGRELIGIPPHRRAELGLTRTFQHVALSSELTVIENVAVGLTVQQRTGWFHAFCSWPRRSRQDERVWSRCLDALALFGIEHLADESVSGLPPGSLRLVELARALVGEPGVVMLDEPAAGLNSSETQELLGALQQSSSTDRVMVLVEHDMDLVMGLCDVVHVLDFGSVIAKGSPDEIRNDPDVIRVYLGEE